MDKRMRVIGGGVGIVLMAVFFVTAAHAATAASEKTASDITGIKTSSMNSFKKASDTDIPPQSKVIRRVKVGQVREMTSSKSTWEDQLPEGVSLKEKFEGTTRTLEGRVNGAGFNGLAVGVSGKRERGAPSEYWFNYTKGIELSGIKRLAELQEGDTVRVGYKEGKDGVRILREITLVSKKPAEPPAKETPDKKTGGTE